MRDKDFRVAGEELVEVELERRRSQGEKDAGAGRDLYYEEFSR